MLRTVVFILAFIILVPIIRGVLGALVKLLTGWASTAQPQPQRAPTGPPPAPVPSTLRQDPVCGAYVSEDIAVTLRSGNGVMFFCSTACRDKYQARG